MTAPQSTQPTPEQQLAGALYGALVGDALGVPVEFDSRETLRKHPVKKMEGYGAWQQPQGTWSDDGALTLASARTLTQLGLDYAALADAFVAWWREGYMCAGDSYFDIGGVTRTALSHWMVAQTNPQANPDPCAMGGDDVQDNGNGALMRIMPVALWTAYEDGYGKDDFPSNVERASAITHGHWQSKMACVFYAMVARAIVRMGSVEKKEIFDHTRVEFLDQYSIATLPKKYEMFWRVTNPRFAEIGEEYILSGGYVIESLEASLWCWLNTDSYREAVLKAVNLGGDTDTTGCITGALAGLYYGVDDIPPTWRRTLRKPKLVTDTVNDFVAATLHHWEQSTSARASE